MGIVLASASPRRRELLERMNLDFEIRTASHDETMDPDADPAEEVARVSLLKAQAVRSLCTQEDLIIAADTIVVSNRIVMGKPHSQEEAIRMLHRLSGKDHQVMTGLTVMQGENAETVTVTTTLRFRDLSDEEICAYVATGEPMDKAGAYAVQGLAAMFVERLDGDYYNVMGLPVCTLAMMLRRRGIRILGC